jgi:hypothetical protein
LCHYEISSGENSSRFGDFQFQERQHNLSNLKRRSLTEADSLERQRRLGKGPSFLVESPGPLPENRVDLDPGRWSVSWFIYAPGPMTQEEWESLAEKFAEKINDRTRPVILRFYSDRRAVRNGRTWSSDQESRHWLCSFSVSAGKANSGLNKVSLDGFSRHHDEYLTGIRSWEYRMGKDAEYDQHLFGTLRRIDEFNVVLVEFNSNVERVVPIDWLNDGDRQYVVAEHNLRVARSPKPTDPATGTTPVPIPSPPTSIPGVPPFSRHGKPFGALEVIVGTAGQRYYQAEHQRMVDLIVDAFPRQNNYRVYFSLDHVKPRVVSGDLGDFRGYRAPREDIFCGWDFFKKGSTDDEFIFWDLSGFMEDDLPDTLPLPHRCNIDDQGVCQIRVLLNDNRDEPLSEEDLRQLGRDVVLCHTPKSRLFQLWFFESRDTLTNWKGAAGVKDDEKKDFAAYLAFVLAPVVPGRDGFVAVDGESTSVNSPEARLHLNNGWIATTAFREGEPPSDDVRKALDARDGIEAFLKAQKLASASDYGEIAERRWQTVDETHPVGTFESSQGDILSIRDHFGARQEIAISSLAHSERIYIGHALRRRAIRQRFGK